MALDKLMLYGAASTAFAAAVISNALSSRQNFYAAAVQVGRSSGAIMVLVNFCFFVTLCLGLIIKKIFFGQLRPVEIEHLYDRSWFFFTESMLALTIFRDDFDAQFIMMFMLLLFLKCFHWICIDRVEYMDQVPPPGPPRSFHLRLSTILAMLSALDVFVAWYCINEVIEDFGGMGGGGMVLFASEYSILTNMAFTILSKYVINLIDLRRAVRMGGDDAPPWEEKSMWVFYVDLVSDALRLIIYGAFFYTIFTFFGSLPINHLHSLYATIRSFAGKVRDLMRYRRATRNMDERYPDATEEEVGRLGGGSCVICREEMVAKETRQRDGAEPQGQRTEGPNDTPKMLACGHVFHFHCLRSWLERQQSCPTCRRTVLDDRTTTTAARREADRPAPPQPGQIPVTPTPPRATATPTAPSTTGPILPVNANLGIWGPPGIPMTIPRDSVMGSGFGLPPTSSWPPPAFAPTQINGLSTRNGSLGGLDSSTSMRNSPTAITPISSQAPDVFTPPSQSHFEKSSVISTGIETPAQMAAAAAQRRLQKLLQTEQRKEVVEESSNGMTAAGPSTRSPYLVPLKPMRAGSQSILRSPSFRVLGTDAETPSGIISSLNSTLEELHGMLTNTTGRLRVGLGAADVDKSRRELDEHLRGLQELDRKVGDSLDEVTVAMSLLPPLQGNEVEDT